MIVVAENFEKAFGERPRIVKATGVGHWLAAARLRVGKIDFYSEAFQNFDCCHTDLWVELVNVTGNEEADAHSDDSQGGLKECTASYCNS